MPKKKNYIIANKYVRVAMDWCAKTEAATTAPNEQITGLQFVTGQSMPE